MADTANVPKLVVDAEELIALIKAIKFAYEDYGYKRVHEQIKTHGEKYARVPLKRVKKYMQKLGLANNGQVEGEEEEEHTGAESAASADTAVAEPNLKAKAKASAKAGAIQLMTVGGKSKSERPTDVDASGASSVNDDKWLPVKLDEPASKTKQWPYQAVIRMMGSEEGDASGALGEIYKIQVAMEADGSLSNVSPMLVYNKARNRKTFLHTDSPAYHPVQRLVKVHGLNGAVGGAKAYFWGRYRKQDDMLYINTEYLAPFQQW